jgi:hypothetical protein
MLESGFFATTVGDWSEASWCARAAFGAMSTCRLASRSPVGRRPNVGSGRANRVPSSHPEALPILDRIRSFVELKQFAGQFREVRLHFGRACAEELASAIDEIDADGGKAIVQGTLNFRPRPSRRRAHE